ncbi:MAG: hypothetical protein Q7S96_00065 [bacterium]|nr:hypothetical protein [bacterium]
MPSETPTMDPMEHFVETLIASAGFTALPIGAHEQLVIQVRDQVQRRTGVLAVRELDADGLGAMRALLEQEPAPSSEAVQEFFQARIPDFPQKLERELDAFAESFLAAAQPSSV